MKRFALLLAVLVAAAAVAPAAAQTAHPTPTSAANYKKIHVTSLTNPGAQSHNAGTMSGAGCTSNVMASRTQSAVNPINGQAQAAPIVSIPLSKGGGSIPNATTKAQQTQACAHTR